MTQQNLARFLIYTVLMLFPYAAQAQVAWVPKFDDALKQAQAEGKFIIVDVSASWCPPCQRMARDVYPDAEFIQFSKTQVFMLVDAEVPGEGIRLARKFDVNVYPTIVVLDSKGQEIDRLTGGRNTKGLIEDLKEIFDDPVPYKDIVEKARAQNDDFQLQYKAGKRSEERGDYPRARQFLGRAASLSSGRPALEIEQLLQAL